MNTTPLVVHDGDAELVALPHGGAFHLLADAPAAAGALGANRLTLGPGAVGARLHYHALSTELFYVLDGRMEFTLNGEVVAVGRGGLVVVPPRVPHAFGAASGSTADVLAVLTPGVERFGYFRELGRIAVGERSFADLLPEQDRYDVHFLDAQAAR